MERLKTGSEMMVAWTRMLAIELGERMNSRFILDIDKAGLTHIIVKEERGNEYHHISALSN